MFRAGIFATLASSQGVLASSHAWETLSTYDLAAGDVVMKIAITAQTDTAHEHHYIIDSPGDGVPATKHHDAETRSIVNAICGDSTFVAECKYTSVGERGLVTGCSLDAAPTTTTGGTVVESEDTSGGTITNTTTTTGAAVTEDDAAVGSSTTTTTSSMPDRRRLEASSTTTTSTTTGANAEDSVDSQGHSPTTTTTTGAASESASPTGQAFNVTGEAALCTGGSVTRSYTLVVHAHANCTMVPACASHFDSKITDGNGVSDRSVAFVAARMKPSGTIVDGTLERVNSQALFQPSVQLTLKTNIDAEPVLVEKFVYTRGGSKAKDPDAPTFASCPSLSSNAMYTQNAKVLCGDDFQRLRRALATPKVEYTVPRVPLAGSAAALTALTTGLSTNLENELLAAVQALPPADRPVGYQNMVTVTSFAVTETAMETTSGEEIDNDKFLALVAASESIGSAYVDAGVLDPVDLPPVPASLKDLEDSVTDLSDDTTTSTGTSGAYSAGPGAFLGVLSLLLSAFATRQ